MKKDVVTPLRIRQFIIDFRKTHPYGPSVTEIAAAIGKKYYNTLRIIREYDGKLWTRTQRVNGSINALPLENQDEALPVE